MTIDSDSDNESFKSFLDDDPAPAKQVKQQSSSSSSRVPLSRDTPRDATSHTTADSTVKPPPVERFSPEEETALLTEANNHKLQGNTLFGTGSYEGAIQNYDRALSSCPNYLEYELAVLRSNVAACHLKLSEWKEAVTSAEKGIDCLERLEKLPRPKKKPKEAVGADKKASTLGTDDNDDAIEEVDDDLEARIENLRLSGHTLDEVRRLQIKLLLRRAKARTELGGWSSLQGAEEDYTILLLPAMAGSLNTTDRRTVTDALRSLAPRLNAARDSEVAEMMGKLKGLGNSILKPFGMSTENFQFVKDEKTGGYSMNFNQNPGK